MEEVVGSDLVSDEVSAHAVLLPRLNLWHAAKRMQHCVRMQDAKRYCREVVRVIRTLREKRDMSLNEIKLTLAIEDPTTRDQKNYMGVEVESLVISAL